METLQYPRPEEIWDPEFNEILKEAKDLSTEEIVNILKGKSPSHFFDPRDLREVLLRRNITFHPDETSPVSLIYLYYLILLFFLFIMGNFYIKYFLGLLYIYCF